MAIILYSPYDAEADFAVHVQVGVEPDCSSSSCQQLHPRRLVGVGWGSPQEEMKQAPLVRGSDGPHHKSMNLKITTGIFCPIKKNLFVLLL